MSVFPQEALCKEPDCDTIFMAGSGSQVRCPPCQRERTRRKQRIYAQKYRNKKRKLPPSNLGYAIIPQNGEWPPNCEMSRMCANYMLHDASWPEGIMLRSLSSGKLYRVEGEMVTASLDVGRDPQTVVEVKGEQDV